MDPRRLPVGGELRSRKGLNLPGIDLGISAFTKFDYDCLKFALENGVDAVSQSFRETRADVDAVRKAVTELGHRPFIVAKIERAGALAHIDEILKAADGIMIARGSEHARRDRCCDRTVSYRRPRSRALRRVRPRPSSRATSWELVVLTKGPSPRNLHMNPRVEIIDLRRDGVGK
jgi:hypothetical protein